MLRPRHRFEPFLLHLFLAIRADAVFLFLDALQRRVNQVHDLAVRIRHAKEKFFGVGVRRLVRQIHRGIFVRRAAFFLRACDGLHQLLAARQQLLLIVLEPFLVHDCLGPCPRHQYLSFLQASPLSVLFSPSKNSVV